MTEHSGQSRKTTRSTKEEPRHTCDERNFGVGQCVFVRNPNAGDNGFEEYGELSGQCHLLSETGQWSSLKVPYLSNERVTS